MGCHNSKKIEVEVSNSTEKTDIETTPIIQDVYTQEVDGNETLEDIAKQHSIPIDNIRKMNPNLPANRKLKAGTPVIILTL